MRAAACAATLARRTRDIPGRMGRPGAPAGGGGGGAAAPISLLGPGGPTPGYPAPRTGPAARRKRERDGLPVKQKVHSR